MNSTEYVNELCEKFGVAISELIPQMQHYMIVKYSTILYISVVATVLCIYLIIRISKGNKFDIDTREFIITVMSVVSAVVFGTLIICSIYCLSIWALTPNMAFIEYITGKI